MFATGLIATPGDTTIYSDIGMITMGKVVEKITGMPLDAFVRKEFFEPLGMMRTTYAPPESLAAQCAPTEIDTLWRKRLVQGQVRGSRTQPCSTASRAMPDSFPRPPTLPCICRCCSTREHTAGPGI